MLTKLLPDQIAKFWPVIKFAIEESLPPIVGEHPEKMNRILASTLSNRTDVWTAYHRNGDGTKLEGLVLTKILYDEASATKNLLIYCIYGYTDIRKETWPQAFQALAKYAKRQGCSFITAYTDLPHIVSMASSLGAETKYTFISFDMSKYEDNN